MKRIIAVLALLLTALAVFAAARARAAMVLASWYWDGGPTACGFHARYGVANRTLRCGALVLLRHHRSAVVATVDDRGPFIYGRTFDLNQDVRAALGCGGLCWIWASQW